MSVVLTPTIEKYNRETTIDHDYLSWNSAHWKSVNGHENQGCPDHTQLPETDGSIVVNFQEFPQSALLSNVITPVLKKIHPDGQYAIGQNSLIYWKLLNRVIGRC